MHIRGTMTGLKDLTGSKYQYHAYTGCFDGISQIRNTFHKFIHFRGILTGLQYLKGSNHQFDAFTGYFDGTSRHTDFNHFSHVDTYTMYNGGLKSFMGSNHQFDAYTGYYDVTPGSQDLTMPI